MIHERLQKVNVCGSQTANKNKWARSQRQTTSLAMSVLGFDSHCVHHWHDF